MRRHQHKTPVWGAVLVAALSLLNGCNEPGMIARPAGEPPGESGSASSTSLIAGTIINVALGDNISSETATVGEVWHGTVTQNVITGNGGAIPPGSEVTGLVTAVRPAQGGSLAMLDLHVESIRVHGHLESISASAEPVVAGSTRARNLGAIVGAAAAGALIGKVVGDGRNAAVGGLAGAAVAAGIVAESKGYQVVLTDGTVMIFTVIQTVAMR